MLIYLILCSDVKFKAWLETICELSVRNSNGLMQTKSQFNPKLDSQSVKELLAPTYRPVGFQNPGFSVGCE